MLQHDTPDDDVIASGTNYSVADSVDCTFSHLGLDYRQYVEVDPRFYREAEAVPLCGDASKIQRVLGWQSTKSFEAIATKMVDYDLALLG